MGINVAMLSSWKTRCGVASYTENLAMALAKQGVNVFIVRIPRFGKRTIEIWQNILVSIPVDKIDLIHCQHEYGIWTNFEPQLYPALKKLGRPIVTTMHAVGAWEIDHVIANASDAIIVHNEFCFRRFGFPEKTGIIPHGASPLKTPPPPKEECRKSLAIHPKTPIVGYLGFISSYKGLEVLIEAMIKVPNAALLIGGGWHVEGETHYIVNLKELTLKALPNRCRWLGFVSDEDLSRVYGAMDIVVYPSRYATESGALIMALSHEKAVIANRLSPFKEKEKQGALMTFKRDDEKNLSRKIKRVLKDEALRHKLEEGAKAYAESTSWENIATRHISLYKELLDG